MKKNTGRRQFVKSSVIGLSGLSLVPALATAKSRSPKDAQNKLNILCLGAHPGDPEFGCGGTMTKYSKAGNTVVFLYLTRGEAYDDKQSHEVSAALRTKEAEASCKILNAKPLFAGQIDGDTVLNKQSNEAIAKMILDQKPDIVFTQWPLDSHPDHQVTGLLALTAWIRANRKFHLYFYEVNTGSETMSFTPTDYVDITDVRELKKAAMFAHATQGPKEIYDDYFKTLEEFRGLEAGVKAAEAFIHFKPTDKRATMFGL